MAEKGWGALLPVRLHDVSPRARRCRRSPPTLAAENAAALETVERLLPRASWAPIRPASATGEQTVARDGPRRRRARRPRVLELDGPRAITAIRGQDAARATARTRWPPLRKLVLRITWDGQKKPAVWCPLGDFFGTAPGVNLLQVAADRHDRRRAATPTGTCRLPRTPWSSWSTKTAGDREIEFEIVHAPLGAAVRGPGPLPLPSGTATSFPLPEGPLARLDHAADRKAAGGSAA